MTDQSNVLVPNASVTMKDVTTSLTRSTTTNSAGRYVFVDVTPGTYDITVTKRGFSTVLIANQIVEAHMVSTK